MYGRRRPDGGVGNVVRLMTHDDPGPHVGLLEGWDGRGVVLRFVQLGARLYGTRDAEPAPPLLVRFPWAVIAWVGVTLEDVGPS